MGLHKDIQSVHVTSNFENFGSAVCARNNLYAKLVTNFFLILVRTRSFLQKHKILIIFWLTFH